MSKSYADGEERVCYQFSELSRKRRVSRNVVDFRDIKGGVYAAEGRNSEAMFFTGSLLLMFAVAVAAQSCSSSGVDIQDGGTYFIDTSSSASFSFISLFAGSGCSSGTSISPVVIDAGGTQHSCSSISESTGVDEESTWHFQSLISR